MKGELAKGYHTTLAVVGKRPSWEWQNPNLCNRGRFLSISNLYAKFGFVHFGGIKCVM